MLGLPRLIARSKMETAPKAGKTIIIIHNLYSAALLKDPAALYNNGNVNIKSVR